MAKILFTKEEREEMNSQKNKPRNELSFYQKVKTGAMKSRVGLEKRKRKLKSEKRSWLYILGGKKAVIRDIEAEKMREKRFRSSLKPKKRKVVKRQIMQQPTFGQIDFGIPAFDNQNKRRKK